MLFFWLFFDDFKSSEIKILTVLQIAQTIIIQSQNVFTIGFSVFFAIELDWTLFEFKIGFEIHYRFTAKSAFFSISLVKRKFTAIMIQCRPSFIVCIRTGRQFIGIEKTSEILTSALQMPSTYRTKRTSEEIVSVNFDEPVNPTDTEADLLLRRYFQHGSKYSQVEDMTEQKGSAESHETTDDTSIFIAHHGLIDTVTDQQRMLPHERVMSN